MGDYHPASASTVCDQCKKRKKSCTKTLPSCSRCKRLVVKCSYSDVNSEGVVLPLLSGVAHRLVLPPFSEEDDHVSGQALRLLGAITRKGVRVGTYCETYFNTFNISLPIVNKESFCHQLQHSPPNSHFSTLLLSMILVAYLSCSTSERPEELLPKLKEIFGLLQSGGKVSVELVQAASLIAAYEHCQGMQQDSWLGIGTAARMGYTLGLHYTVKEDRLEDEVSRVGFETRRCLWWSIVVLERIINLEYKHNKLPFASQAPSLDDFLPSVPEDNEISYQVSEDLILPDMVDETDLDLFNREFTKISDFGSTIQATYLSSLVTRHISTEYKDHISREQVARKLDAALQSFTSTLIPPPGKSNGRYCGAFGMRTAAAFALHLHEFEVETQARRTEGISRATLALQSMARFTIHMLKVSNVGKPIELDTLSFWAHMTCVHGALVHIKFGVRDQDWEGDLRLLQMYLRYFAPRYRLYEDYLRLINEAMSASGVSSKVPSVIPLAVLDAYQAGT